MFLQSENDLGAVTLQVKQMTKRLLFLSAEASFGKIAVPQPFESLTILPPALTLASSPLIKMTADGHIKINIALSSPLTSPRLSIIARHNGVFLDIQHSSNHLELIITLPSQAGAGGLVRFECLDEVAGLIGKGCHVILLPSTISDGVMEELGSVIESDPLIEADLGGWLEACATLRVDRKIIDKRRRTGLHLLSHSIAKKMSNTALFLIEHLVKHCGLAADNLLYRTEYGIPDNLPLLHIVMRSSDPHLLRSILAWAHDHEVNFNWGVRSHQGLSPLHILALLPNAQEMAYEVGSEIISKRPPNAAISAPVAWAQVRCSNGQSPADFYSSATSTPLVSFTELTGSISQLTLNTLWSGFKDPGFESSFLSFMASKCRLPDLLFPLTLIAMAITSYLKADPPISLADSFITASPLLLQAFAPTLLILLCPSKSNIYSRLRTTTIVLSNVGLCILMILIGRKVISPPGGKPYWPFPRQPVSRLAVITCVWKINKAIGNQLTVPLALCLGLVDWIAKWVSNVVLYEEEAPWAAAATGLGLIIYVLVMGATEWRTRSSLHKSREG